jgi:hypothetical protein
MRSIHLLAFAIVAALPQTGSAQTLTVSVEAAKRSFFEGEPIYLLVRVMNTGSDTAWVMPPDLGSRSVALETTTAEGSEVPELRLWLDRIYPPAWRGVPIAPGASWYETAVLQDFFGDAGPERSPIFNRHLRPGGYRVVARYNPSVTDEATAIVASVPIEIDVRPRTAVEDVGYRDVARVRELAWTPGGRSRYPGALLDLVARRQAEAGDDPFVPFLLNQGVATLPALGVRVEGRVAATLQAMRLAAAQANKDTPAGAMAALSAWGGNGIDATAVSQQLAGSLSAEVIRERENRARSRTRN